jgi:hypothetical protein
MYRTGSGSCPLVDFRINIVGPSACIARLCKGRTQLNVIAA